MKFNPVLYQSGTYTRCWESLDFTCRILAYDRTDGEPGGWKVTRVWVAVYVRDEFYGGIECHLDGVVAFVVKEIMDIIDVHGLEGTAMPFKMAARRFFDQLTPRATLAKFQAYKEQL